MPLASTRSVGSILRGAGFAGKCKLPRSKTVGQRARRWRSDSAHNNHHHHSLPPSCLAICVMSDANHRASAAQDGLSTPTSQYASPDTRSSASSSPQSSEGNGPPDPQRSKTAPLLQPPNVDTVISNDIELRPTSPILAEMRNPEHQPALRRTSSALSTGSSSGQTAREKKRLRFTPVAQEDRRDYDHESNRMEYLMDAHDLEDGLGRRTVKGKGVPRDQASYLRSDPGTPNLSET